ncbi:MAG: acyl-CoA synthetase FdrA [Roseburia sp.]|nr:acyl-CoA synthetase FdrA [Roseburia sp.]
MEKILVKKNSYYDSVTLMLISQDVKKIDGVQDVIVGMGTELNLELSRKMGLELVELDQVTVNDMFIAARVSEEGAWTSLCTKVEELLNKKNEDNANEYFPASLASARNMMPDLNLALISIPGKYAYDVAKDCLDKDIHVMLFSDNVTIEEEKKLKEYAVSKGLLMMGPDCGTAIINNVPLAFSNVVKKGNIGLVGASGTGTQEVTSVIDRLGGGLSQVIGTGGRDLKKEIGGLMMKLGLEALKKDERTEVIVVVSKPPAEEVSEEILDIVAEIGKPSVVCFIGGDATRIEKRGIVAASTLEEAAYKAVCLAEHKPVVYSGKFENEEETDRQGKEISGKMAAGQKYIRGLYTGGTLCDEAMKILHDDLGVIYSNVPLKQEENLENPVYGKSKGNTFLDFGDDAFTVGRAHPMIDPSLRAARIVEEAKDTEVAVILVDCVIGYGSHPNPAHDLAESFVKAADIAKTEGRELCMVASVCGTYQDPQGYEDTVRQLTEAGAHVFDTNAKAARFCWKVLAQRR